MTELTYRQSGVNNIMKKISLVLILSTIFSVIITTSYSIKKNSTKEGQSNLIISTSSDLARKKVSNIEIRRSYGSFYVPQDIDDLFSKSDLVVIGVPIQSISESTSLVKRNTEGDVTEAISQTEFKVLHIIKGSSIKRGDVIPVGQQAAVITDLNINSKTFLQVVDEYQPLVKNLRYVLFLAKGLNNSSLYFPIGAYHGKFNIDGKDNLEDENKDSKFKMIKGSVIQKYKKIADQAE